MKVINQHFIKLMLNLVNYSLFRVILFNLLKKNKINYFGIKFNDKYF